MILTTDVKLLTKNGMKEWSKPNIRFYLNDTTLTKGFDYKQTTTNLDMYAISVKEGCVEIFSNGKVLTSRGYVDISELEIGDTLIFHKIHETDYGASTVVLAERKISAIYSHKSENVPCLEVPYEEIIVNGLYIKA